jgi:predicted RND superfamily exporter protein
VNERDRGRDIPERWVRASTRRPGLVFAIWAVLAGFASLGVAQLTIDTSTDSVLERTGAEWQFYQASQDLFGGDELIVVALETEQPLAPSALTAVRTLTDELLEIEGVRRVDGLASVSLIRATPDGGLDLSAALERRDEIPSTAAEVAALSDALRADRIAPAAFVSPDGRFLSVNLVLDHADEVDFVAVVTSVQEIAERYGARVSGVPVFRTETNAWTRREVASFVPLTVIVVGLVLFLTFGSLRAVWIPMGTSAFGSWAVLGALGATGTPLSVFTMILPSVMLALGCAYVMHMLTAALEAPNPESLTDALAKPAYAIALSGLTTTIGFVALSQVRIDAVWAVGAFGGLGVGVVLAASLTLAPAALTRFPLPARETASQRWVRGPIRLALVRIATERPARVIAVWLVLVAVFLVGVMQLAVVTDVTVWFPHGTPVRDDYEVIRERLSGISPMNVVVQGAGGERVDSPAALAAIHGLTSHLQAHPDVGKALSWAEPLLQVHSVFVQKSDPPLPDRPDLIAQYLLHLDGRDEFADLLSSDRRGANVVLRANDNGSTSLLDVARSAEAWWRDNGPANLSARTTGIMYEFARAEHEIAMGQLRGLAFALVAIAIVLRLAFRRTRLALMALLPNAIPVSIVFGTMGFTGIPLDAGTVLVGSLALGIAVDDAVHLIDSFHVRESAGDAPKQALNNAFSVVLPAIVFTSVAIAAGFSALAFSQFTFIRHLGVLTAGVMLLCLLSNATLLAALLVTRGAR